MDLSLDIYPTQWYVWETLKFHPESSRSRTVGIRGGLMGKFQTSTCWLRVRLFVFWVYFTGAHGEWVKWRVKSKGLFIKNKKVWRWMRYSYKIFWDFNVSNINRKIKYMTNNMIKIILYFEEPTLRWDDFLTWTMHWYHSLCATQWNSRVACLVDGPNVDSGRSACTGKEFSTY